MKITDTSRTTRMLTIEGAERLDPIDVFITNYAPGKGRMTIRCWDRAWTCAWFAMAGQGKKQTIEQFFLEADPAYIIANFGQHGMRVDAMKRDAQYLRRLIAAIKEALQLTMPIPFCEPCQAGRYAECQLAIPCTLPAAEGRSA